MRTQKTIRTALVAACSVGLLAATPAQEAETKVKVGEAEGKATINRPENDRDVDRNVTREEDPIKWRSDRATRVGKLNKASGILGMTVVNRENEKLGTIKEVVLDVESGKIAYAVLSVGGFLGIGDKLIAVPPGAFSPSGNGDSLELRADKAMLEGTPGLVQDNWPELNNPQFSAHWNLDPNGTATGASASVERSRGSSVEVDTDREGNARIESRTDISAEGGKVFSGRIVFVDPEKRIIRVESGSETREFTFTDKPTLATGLDNRNPKLVDFKVGYNVNVGYHEEDGRFVAHSLMRKDPSVTR
jgi:sporulation protein YlmC with PRC-barrel domain